MEILTLESFAIQCETIAEKTAACYFLSSLSGHSINTNTLKMIAEKSPDAMENPNVSIVANAFRSFGKVVSGLGDTHEKIKNHNTVIVPFSKLHEIPDMIKKSVEDSKKSTVDLGNGVTAQFYKGTGMSIRGRNGVGISIDPVQFNKLSEGYSKFIG